MASSSIFRRTTMHISHPDSWLQETTCHDVRERLYPCAYYVIECGRLAQKIESVGRPDARQLVCHAAGHALDPTGRRAYDGAEHEPDSSPVRLRSKYHSIRILKAH